MKKTKILFILLLSLSSLFIACDKGENSVDFAYSQDSKDPRIFYFQASGSSDYGDFDYRWDFGKGNTASGSSASHQFDTYGNHVVTLYADIDKSGIHSCNNGSTFISKLCLLAIILAVCIVLV